LDSLILNLTIEWQEKEYGYEDVCAIWNSKCLENQILNLNEIMPEVENGTRYIDYPIMLFPPVFPFYYGGAKVNETEGYLESVKAIALHYWLKQDNWMQKERSILFENKVLELLSSKEFENINVAPFVSMSLEDELEDNTSSILGYLPPTVLIMIIFSLISIMSFDWVRSKMQISV
ncbi:UNVERIFIED_CONTAM: hypothetical protein GTU68_022797, partial [Idotea baltica]|nr:hypothetical protein [Idotea baltica]